MGNFFDFIMVGMISIMETVISIAPIATTGLIPIPLLNAIPTLMFMVTGVILFFVGPFLNLGVFVAVLVPMVLAEGFRIALATYRFILKLIPGAS